MYVYFVRLTSYQLNTLYPQQLVTLTLDSTCHPSWRTWHSYRTTWSQHSQRYSSATSVQPFFLVSSWGCSTPRNTCTELPTQPSDSAHPGTSIHADATRLSPCRADIAFISPSISTHHPWFWQLHEAKPQTRDCTCTRLHKTQLQLTASILSVEHFISSTVVYRHPIMPIRSTTRQPC